MKNINSKNKNFMLLTIISLLMSLISLGAFNHVVTKTYFTVEGKVIYKGYFISKKSSITYVARMQYINYVTSEFYGITVIPTDTTNYNTFNKELKNTEYEKYEVGKTYKFRVCDSNIKKVSSTYDVLAPILIIVLIIGIILFFTFALIAYAKFKYNY